MYVVLYWYGQRGEGEAGKTHKHVSTWGGQAEEQIKDKLKETGSAPEGDYPKKKKKGSFQLSPRLSQPSADVFSR